MFGIGMPELLLILAVALIVIGPKKLPDLARSLGKAMGEFKKATSELKDSIQIDSELKSVKTTFDDLEKDLKKAPTTDKPASEADVADASDASDPMASVKAAFHRDEAQGSASHREKEAQGVDSEAEKDHAEAKPSGGVPT